MIGTLSPSPVELWLEGMAFVVASTAIAWLVSGWAVDRWREPRPWRVQGGFSALTALWSVALVLRHGCTVDAMAGALYGIVALTASYADWKSWEVADNLHLMLLLVGLVGAQPQEVPAMALAGGVAALPMLVVVLVFGCPLGGADLKYTAAFAFGTGLVCGTLGLVLGLLLAVVHQTWKRRQSQGFPLIPYLSVGNLVAYYVSGGMTI